MSNVIARRFGDITPVVQDKVIQKQITELGHRIEEGCESGELEPTGMTDDFLTHHFAPGVYCREYFIKAGSLIIGKIHKYAHMNIIAQGHVTVKTQYGVDVLHAPAVFRSEMGTQRVVFAHTDTVWTTIHPTDCTDPDEIVDAVTAKDYDEIDEMIAMKKIEGETT